MRVLIGWFRIFLGPASITDLPASLDFELNAFSKDFTQFNLNAAESGISKTTG